MPTFVELPVGSDLIQDRAGNVQKGATATVKLRDTATTAPHYKADGTDVSTGPLIVRGDGTIGTINERRYFPSGQPVDVTVAGRTRKVEPLSAYVETGVGRTVPGLSESDESQNAAKIQAMILADVADGRDGMTLRLPRQGGSFGIVETITTPAGFQLEIDGGGSELVQMANVPIFQPGVSPRAVSSLPLTVDVDVGDITLTMSTVNAEALAAAGATHLDLRSNILFGANAPLNEVVRIKSINTGTGVIELYGPVEETYLVADSARVYVMSFGGTLSVLDLAFRNSTPDARPSAINEVQDVALTGGPIAGSYTLTWPANSLGIGTSPSGAIELDFDEEAIEDALDPVLGVDNYKIDGDGTGFEITYRGDYEFRNVPAPTVDTSSLTGGTPGATVTTVATGGPAPENVNAIRALGLVNPHFERCDFIGIDQVGIDLIDCLGGEICNSHWIDLSDNLTFGRSGYGVRAVGSTSAVKVHDNTSQKGRHFFTTSGAVRHIDVYDNKVTEHTNVPFDCHAGARHVKFKNNRTERCNGGSYQTRSADVTIEDPTIIGNGSTGPQIYSWAKNSGVTYPGYSHGTKILNGDVEGCAGNLIKVNNADDVLIKGLRVRKHRLGASALIYVTACDRSSVLDVRAEATPGDTGWLLEQANGDGHSFDDLYGKNMQLVVRPRAGLTNLRAGKVSGDNITNFIGSEWAASALELPRLSSSVTPEGNVRAPVGAFCQALGSQWIKAAGGHSTTGWAPLGAPDVDLIEASSQVSTIPTRRNLSSQTITINEALGIAAVCRETNTYTKGRFATGATVTVTDVRLAVHDISGVKLGESADISGTLTTNAVIDNVPFLAGVPLALGDEVMPSIAAAGTTMTVQGQSFGLAGISSLGAHRRTRRAAWAGATVVPALGTATGAAHPWIELMPA